MKELELLAPARNKEIGIAAINCGADAVYIAAENFGAREAASNNIQEIKDLCEYAHLYNVNIFVVVNTILYNDEIDRAVKLIWDVYNAGADAVIIQDLGLLLQNLPPISVYASTQTDIRDKNKAQLLENLGFGRLILARELSLLQMREISDSVNVDLEAFVHGALCVSYSGQCYLSRKITGRSANRGECVQACRNNYNLLDANGKVIIKNTHLLSLKDYNLSNRIKDLVLSGISSFKIEGRLKNESFVRNSVLLYNKKINEFLRQNEGSNFERSSLGYIETKINPNPYLTFNRGFTDLFIDSKRGDWKSSDSAKYIGEYIGNITNSKLNRQGFMEFSYKSNKKIVNGDGLCYVANNGEIIGFRANSCNPTNNIVTTTERSIIKNGTKLFRNYNFTYEKSLEKREEKRYIPLLITFIANDNFSIKVECYKSEKSTVPFFSFIFPINASFELAENTEAAENNIKMQFSKKSSHFSFQFKEFEGTCNKLPFFPISTLNAIRRDIALQACMTIENLYKKKRIDREIDEIARREKCKTFLKQNNGISFFSQKETDKNWKPFLLNASNDASKKLYAELQICLNASSYEIEQEENAVLMRTKYCIKYQLGLCKKNLSGNKVSENLKNYKEPLFLCNNDNKFRLEFDCTKCEMMLIG